MGETGALVAGAFEPEPLDTVGRSVALGGGVGVTTVGAMVSAILGVLVGTTGVTVGAHAETISRAEIKLNFRIIFHLAWQDNKWTSKQPHEFLPCPKACR